MASRTRLGGRAAVAGTRRLRDRLSAVHTSRAGRVASTHQHGIAAGLFALLVLVYLWPALVGGGVLLPSAVLYELVPWQGSAPPGANAYFNGNLHDVPFSYYPWDVLARELLHAGVFPAWNPHAFAGTPFFANPEVAWLSPFGLPLWTLPLRYALGVAAALKLWMAAFGTYLLVRELKLGFWPGIVAGIAFALCSFNVVWLSHGAHVSVAVLLPWTIWLVERIVRHGRAVDSLALAGIAAFVLTGGHPGTQLHVLAAAVLYALVRVATYGGVARRERIRRLSLVGAGLLVGLLLTAVVLLPADRAAVDTAGAAARRGGSVGFLGSDMPLGTIRAALFPEWWGRPNDGLLLGPSSYAERAFYTGSATIVLALLGLLAAGGWRRKAPFALLGALGLAIPLRTPGLYELVIEAPLFTRVQNQRVVLLFLLAAAVLAAFGLQAILDAEGRRRRWWIALALSLLPIVLALGSLDLDGATLREAQDFMLHRSGVTTPDSLALASVGWFALFAATLVPIALLARRWPRRSWLAGGLVALVVALDMLHVAHGYQPMGPAAIVVPPRTPAIAFLQRHADEGRIAGVETALTADWSTTYGLRDVRGYDAPQPSLRFHRLWQTMNEDQSTHTVFTFPELTRESLTVLGLLGARYVVAESGETPEVGGLAPVYQGPDATIFSNALAMPRAIVAARVRVASSEHEEIAAIQDEAFDPRRDAVVRADELDTPTVPPGAGGRVRVVREENAGVTLRATLPRRGLVVLDDAWAPGWSVEVDGRPARALQTDVVLRGVVVPAGSHEIVWSYRVPGLRPGAALSLLGLLAAVAWGGWLLRGRRRAHVAAG